MVLSVLLNPTRSSNALVIWRLVDGKPGHDNQSLGLVNALKSQVACDSYDIKVGHALDAILDLAIAYWPFAEGLPPPDIIVGAGHTTHLHLLAAKRAYGGKTVVLMKPSIPASLFDLCLIPEHDEYHGWGNYIETRGVLNAIIASNSERDERSSLIMVGGPNKHFVWNSREVVHQIVNLAKLNPEVSYTLTTSRRTPSDFLQILGQEILHLQNIELMPFESTRDGWVAHQLNRVSSAWVTEDSVSMIYEGLTANVAVGLLKLEVRRVDRVVKGLNNLVYKKIVTRFDSHLNGQEMLVKSLGFNEAYRCSQLILRRLFIPVQSRKSRLVFRLG